MDFPSPAAADAAPGAPAPASAPMAPKYRAGEGAVQKNPAVWPGRRFAARSPRDRSPSPTTASRTQSGHDAYDDGHASSWVWSIVAAGREGGVTNGGLLKSKNSSMGSAAASRLVSDGRPNRYSMNRRSTCDRAQRAIRSATSRRAIPPPRARARYLGSGEHQWAGARESDSGRSVNWRTAADG